MSSKMSELGGTRSSCDPQLESVWWRRCRGRGGKCGSNSDSLNVRQAFAFQNLKSCTVSETGAILYSLLARARCQTEVKINSQPNNSDDLLHWF